MRQAPSDRSAWQVGQRVSRKDGEALGTVLETNGSIKVKWDTGQTSYFRHGQPANVQLKGKATSIAAPPVVLLR
jgi:hypothetical protein